VIGDLLHQDVEILGVIVQGETMMWSRLQPAAVGWRRRLIDMELSRARTRVSAPASRYARREALTGGAAERPALGLATPDYQLAVLPENASRNRARSSALTSETAQNVKPPALQDSML